MGRVLKKLDIPASLTNLAYESIRASISNGTFPAGARFTEDLLSRQLGISKSPIREALARVEVEGLIRIEPRRGAIVRAFSTDEIRDLYDMRLALEVHATGSALPTPEFIRQLQRCVEKMMRYQQAGKKEQYLAEDVKFHAAIASCGGNILLSQTLEQIERKIALCRRRTYDLVASNAPDDHVRILNALKVDDILGAQDRMREHIQRALAQMLQSLAAQVAMPLAGT